MSLDTIKKVVDIVEVICKIGAAVQDERRKRRDEKKKREQECKTHSATG